MTLDPEPAYWAVTLLVTDEHPWVTAEEVARKLRVSSDEELLLPPSLDRGTAKTVTPEDATDALEVLVRDQRLEHVVATVEWQDSAAEPAEAPQKRYRFPREV